ncbi:MAG: M57 family metalloprotease [Pseudobacter sp.]|uniref:M57 family metalloprotease n=1 Tax=Pseudobacter sp. TaxID=2045420 RepID=UPI003F7CE042
MKKVQFWLLMGLMAFVFSCKKQDAKNESPEPEQTNKVLSRILEMGFTKSSIVEFDDHYIVGGDIMFHKNPSTVDNPGKVKQYRTYNLVSQDRTLIRVYLDNNFVSIYNNVSAALDEAIAAYKNSINSEILFVRTTDPAQAQITVSRNNFLGTGVCGLGGFPYADGRPFDMVYISETLASGLNHGKLVFLLAHELGHNIGLRHTNWAFNGEAANPEGAVLVPGTPSSDPLSVMNGGTCGFSWGGFPTGDRDAVAGMYPKLASGHSLVGTGIWATTDAMTSMGDTLFAVDNQRLYWINKTTGVYTQIGTQLWTATKAMTSLNGFLYIVENQRIYKVNVATGIATIIGPGVWTATDAMTSLNGWVYIVENQRLYQVDPTTGAYTRQGSLFWTATEGMTSMGSSLYIVESQRLYQVNPTTGAATQLGPIIYGGTAAITNSNGWLYVVVHNRIFKVDTSGNYTQFGGSVWEETSAMTSIGTDLFLVQNSRLYKLPI